MKRLLFGNPELTLFYQICKNFIFKYKFYDVYKLENTEIKSVLTLFNFYRYTKEHQTGKIYAEYWCLNELKWKKERIKKSFTYCEDIPFFSAYSELLLIVQYQVIKQVVEHLQTQYPQFQKTLIEWKSKLIDILKKHFIKQSIILTHYQAHKRHIVKWLWTHFFDKNILSIVIRIEGYGVNINLSSYIYYQRHLSKLKRVKKEFPNLLPLLAVIKPKYWNDPNLFSYDYWVVSQNGEPTLCQKKRFYRYAIEEYGIPLCQTKQQWRWVKKQTATFVRTWLYNQAHLCMLTQHGITDPIPVYVKTYILKHGHLFNITNMIHIQKEQIVRLFLRYVIRYWKNNGIKALRAYLKEYTDSLCDIRDYLNSDAAQNRGLPPTWEYLIDRSEQWHQQLIEQQRRLEDEKHQKQLAKSWSSPLSYYKIEEVEFTALTTGKALYEAGEQMLHCVFNYTDDCYNRKYLVFSVCHIIETTKHYSTLGLFWDARQNKWSIEQHRGVRNQAVNEYLGRIGKQFCKILNKY